MESLPQADRQLLSDESTLLQDTAITHFCLCIDLTDHTNAAKPVMAMHSARTGWASLYGNHDEIASTERSGERTCVFHGLAWMTP